jgi:hypothetical protein
MDLIHDLVCSLVCERGRGQHLGKGVGACAAENFKASGKCPAQESQEP